MGAWPQVEILRKQLLVAVVVVVGTLGKGLDIIFGILVCKYKDRPGIVNLCTSRRTTESERVFMGHTSLAALETLRRNLTYLVCLYLLNLLGAMLRMA